MTERGYLYIATGDFFLDEAKVSVESLRRVNPDAHVTLVTDEPRDDGAFDRVVVLEPPGPSEDGWKDGTLFKVQALRSTPYERTFFIDTDTWFCEPCDELFDLLDHFQLLLCHAPGDRSTVVRGGEPLRGYYPYNTGVLVYTSDEATDALFQRWREVYEEKFELYPHDQTPFMEALLDVDVRTYVLQSNYNFRTPYFTSFVAEEVKILHGRPDSYERIERLVNASLEHRVWLPGPDRVVSRRERLRDRIRDRVYAFTPDFARRAFRRVRAALGRGEKPQRSDWP